MMMPEVFFFEVLLHWPAEMETIRCKVLGLMLFV
jgi:hypothetical protein